ncbi:MAG TPA: hypothetical protein VNJ05_05945 [Sphingomicrobium sp.]|nr:hypothetical protein [Sphingomicrobium sp.]
MAARVMAFCGLLMFATSAHAGEPFGVHGLIVGNEGARYVKGVPTLDLQQQRGAIQLRSLGFHNDRPAFAIAFFNAGPDPVNIGLEDIHVTANGTPLRVFSVQELERQAKKKAWWTKFGLAMLGGLAAGAAASQRDHSYGTITGPYGTYSIHTSYPSLAGQLRANQIQADTAYSIAAVQYQLDRTLELLDNHVVQRTTVDPGASYAGLIVLDKLKAGKPPYELRLEVDWNSERYPFAYVLDRPGKAIPDRYQSMLAANAKPRALTNRFAAPAMTSEPTAPTSLLTAPVPASAPASQMPSVVVRQGPRPKSAAANKSDPAPIVLRSGVVKIPAKTKSGYCLDVPPGYMGTGSVDAPAVTGAMPICKEITD